MHPLCGDARGCAGKTRARAKLSKARTVEVQYVCHPGPKRRISDLSPYCRSCVRRRVWELTESRRSLILIHNYALSEYPNGSDFGGLASWHSHSGKERLAVGFGGVRVPTR